MEVHPSLNNNRNKETGDESLNIREQIDKYLVFWKWFLVSVLCCIIAAGIYLRYTIPLYKTATIILVKDERKGGLQSELSAFEDLGLIKGVKSNVDNELEVIKSYTIIENAVKRLNLNTTYFADGRVKTIELYKDKPITCTVFDVDEYFYKKKKAYKFKFVSETGFELFADGKSLGQFSYGQVLKLEYCKMIIQKNALKNGHIPKDFLITIKFNKLTDIAQNYKNNLSISALGKNTSVVELTLIDPVKEKAEDLLNTIVQIYNEDAIADKNFISQNTEKFIESRLKLISQELGDVERDAEGFKQSNKVTDIISEAGLFLQNSALYEKQLIETETQIRVVASMIEFMKNIGKGDLVPINIIPLEGNTTNLITEHNAYVLERGRLIKDATLKNATIINLDKKIEELKQNINVSLGTLMNSLRIRKADLEKQNNMNSGKIAQIPRQEREFRVIDRQQKIKESLYLYLLQKREEIAISLAVTPANAKVIDLAMSVDTPISPRKNIIFLGALVLGLLIPFLTIYILELLDTKIKTRHDVESKTSIPFLGDIPKSESSDEIINTNSRSSTAEAIRIVRTNLEFMLGAVTEGRAKTIFVTSTLPQEGKTFVAINLATTIALSGKKVLLVGLDIRNPKIDKYVKLPSKGITNYISQKEDNIQKYIVKLPEYENLYVLPSGVIPPNPVELLMDQKVDLLFEQLRQEYEYIIVDTAPVSVVTDTLLIAKNADAFIYVMRANYLDKRLLRLAETFYKDRKLPNMSVVLNDTVWKKSSRYGYGYGYGYGYSKDEEKVPWHKRILKKN